MTLAETGARDGNVSEHKRKLSLDLLVLARPRRRRAVRIQVRPIGFPWVMS